MDHFYRELSGFFTFPDYYTRLAKWLAGVAFDQGRPAHFVEVGVYGGQSLAFLGVELLKLGAAGHVVIDGVDLFHGGVETVRAALKPLAPLDVGLYVGDSAASAVNYADASLDAVFIDASHEYKDVARDIDAWLPKVRPGGIIAGHDFTLHFPGVIQAVTERFERWEVSRGVSNGGDEGMQGKYWPTWSVQL